MRSSDWSSDVCSSDLARRVLARALADESRLEALQQLALLRGEVHRRLHHRLAVQVAGCAAAHRLDALVPQAEDLAGLGLRRDAQLHFPAKRWHAAGVTQRPLRHAHPYLPMPVLALPNEKLRR